MYLPHDEELDLYDAGKLPNYEKMSKERKEELRVKSEERRAKAMQRVRGTIRHWDGFFRNHEQYVGVGKVVGREGVLERTPVRKLCKQAQRKRPPKVVGGEAA